MPPATPPTPAALATPISGADPNLIEKHPAALRWMHWLNFPLLFLMIWSGLMIYWATSAPGANAASSANASYDHQVYRVGIGSVTLFRLFPDSFYHLLHIDGHLTRGIAFHAFFMWLFAANGLAYVLFLAFSGQWRSILPVRHTWKALPRTVLAEIAFRHPVRPRPAGFAPDQAEPAPFAPVNAPLPTQIEGPPTDKYNPAQRLAYTAVILMGAGSLLTGVAIWKPSSLPWITFLCGGYETARWLHFWLTIAFCTFFFVHVAQVLRSGWNTLRSMLMGAELLIEEEPDPDAEIPALPSLNDPGAALPVSSIPALAVPRLNGPLLARQLAGRRTPGLGKRLG